MEVQRSHLYCTIKVYDPNEVHGFHKYWSNFSSDAYNRSDRDGIVSGWTNRPRLYPLFKDQYLESRIKSCYVTSVERLNEYSYISLLYDLDPQFTVDVYRKKYQFDSNEETHGIFKELIYQTIPDFSAPEFKPKRPSLTEGQKTAYPLFFGHGKEFTLNQVKYITYVQAFLIVWLENDELSGYDNTPESRISLLNKFEIAQNRDISHMKAILYAGDEFIETFRFNYVHPALRVFIMTSKLEDSYKEVCMPNSLITLGEAIVGGDILVTMKNKMDNLEYSKFTLK